MGGHGKNRHLKRQNSPLVSGITRKGPNWVLKPIPGKHSIKHALSLLALLRDRLGLAENARQAKKLLINGEVLIDGLKPKKLGIPVGLMDVLSLPKLGKHYRVVIAKGILTLKEISAEHSKVKYCRINGKTVLRKGKVQLNLHDSRSVLIEREEDRFKTGDTILVAFAPKQEIKGFLKMEKGAKCLVFQGKHAGVVGELEEILERAGSMPSNARITVGGKSLLTLKDY